MRYLLILSILLFAGCGGGSSSPAVIDRSVVGNWIGTFSTADQSYHGSMLLQIGQGGQAVASLTSDVTGRMASPHGRVTVTSAALSNAALVMSYFWTPGNAQNGGTTGNYDADVNVSVASDGTMSGIFKQFISNSGAKAPTLNLNLVRQ